ncbi:MAG: hypothetical protein ACE5DK_06610, partial [Paracoccaceae bacterium]
TVQPTAEPQTAPAAQARLDGEDDADEAPIDSSLSEAEEAELQRELEAALALGDDADAVDATADEGETETTVPDAEEEIDEDEPDLRERRARAENLLARDDPDHEDHALDRLLTTTRVKMDEPEQARRVSALDQLRAVVAATQSQAGDPEQQAEAENELSVYREDLRRATSEARSVASPAAEAPAAAQPPLILVSEQRVDAPEPEGETIQPMRVTAQTDGNLALKPETFPPNEAEAASTDIQGIPADAFTDSEGFSDFAERIGAFELQDLLEAAAAYTAIVEESPRFSRAQVMSKIARLENTEDFTKEAGLRSFGRLLREGKILRVQDGQFAISRASRFSIASRQEN